MPRSIVRIAAIPLLIIVLCNTGMASDWTPSTGAIEHAENARRDAKAIQAKLSALPAKCAFGDVKSPALWIDSRAPSGVPGAPYTYDFAFKPAMRASAFHVALNAKALQNLEKVETRDAQGTWSLAWTGTHADAPAGCEFVKLAQRFASSEREVTALRITVHPDREKIVVANAGLRKAD